MKLLTTLALLGFTLAELPTEWQNFKLFHGKNYRDPNEELLRLKIYQSNLDEIKEHNRMYEQGLVTYSLQMNEFGDLTEEEFEEMYLYPSEDAREYASQSYSPRLQEPIPPSKDWREAGAVTPVSDQGNCGSCWAFCAVGAMETMLFLKSGVLEKLSVQHLVDCSRSYKNEGCSGGYPHWAFHYIKDQGIVTESDYPYRGMSNMCKVKYGMRTVRCSDFVLIPPGDEAELAKVVANLGTVSATIVLRGTNFRFYKSGVFYHQNCGNTRPDHAMLIVGYGTSPAGEDYWLVKNSWGSKWGDGGYIKMARNRGNHCGIASNASYPIL